VCLVIPIYTFEVIVLVSLYSVYILCSTLVKEVSIYYYRL
jgi:hypothetical protein